MRKKMRTERQKLADLDKTTDEEYIVKLVNSCKAEADANQAEWAQRARRNIEFYVGNQWLTDEGEADDTSPAWRFRTQLNIVFSTLQTICSAGLDARPRIFYEADVEGEENVAEALTDMIDAWHEARMEEWQVYNTLLWLTCSGIAWRKYTWNAEKNRPEAHIIPSWDVGVDPDGTMPDCSDHKYLIHTKEVDIDDVCALYDVKEEDLVSTTAQDAEADETFMRRLVNRLTGSKASQAPARNRVEINEMWYWGQTPMDLIADGKPSKRLKYPQGRLFTICGKKLLYDSGNPFNHKRCALVPFHGCTAPSGFLGFGLVDQLYPIQFAMNVLISQFIMGTILMANPQWISDEGAIPEGFLTNEPGLHVETTPGMSASVRQLSGTTPPTTILNLVSELLMFSERVSNVSEVMMGRQPAAQTSGVAIAGLQQAASLIIRQFMRWFEGSYKLAAIIEAENVQQFAKMMDPRWLGEMSLGEWFQWDEDIRNLTFDVHVQSMSEMPRNLEGRLAFAMQMLQVGVFDIEEFLDFTRLQVSDRLREKLLAASQPLMPGAGGQPGRGQLAALQGLPNLGQGVPAEAQIAV